MPDDGPRFAIFGANAVIATEKGRPEGRPFQLNRMAQMSDPKVLHHVHAACSARLTR